MQTPRVWKRASHALLVAHNPNEVSSTASVTSATTRMKMIRLLGAPPGRAEGAMRFFLAAPRGIRMAEVPRTAFVQLGAFGIELRRAPKRALGVRLVCLASTVLVAATRAIAASIRLGVGVTLVC